MEMREDVHQSECCILGDEVLPLPLEPCGGRAILHLSRGIVLPGWGLAASCPQAVPVGSWLSCSPAPLG